MFEHMKTLLLLLIFVTAGFAGESEGAPSDTALRTEVVEFDSPLVGHVRYEKTFRGQEKIMLVKTYSNVTTHVLFLHGDLMYVEVDEDADGHFEGVMLQGEWPDDYELFTRHKDGKLEPLSEADYLEEKAKFAKACEALQEALKEAEREFEQNSPANESQPIRPETNRTSPAAGSRR